MTTQVEAFFTVASDTAVTAYTPDTGTGFTSIYNTTVTPPVVNATNDDVRKASLENSTGVAWSAEPDPASDEYFIEMFIKNAPIGTAAFSYAAGAFARRTDNNNHYQFQLLPEAHAEATHKIIKKVSGTPTLLASSDIAGTAGDATNKFYQFRVTDVKKSIVRDGVEICSTTDNAVTGGDVGFGLGNFFTDGNHTATSWAIDNFRVLDVPQEAHPSADQTAGNWTNQAGSATDIYAALDEDRADTSDYAESGDSPNLDVLLVKLQSLTDPVTGAWHYVHAVYQKAGGETIDLRVRLLEDALGTPVEIATWTYAGITAAWTYIRELLTTTQANAISDYTDLWLEFRADVP